MPLRSLAVLLLALALLQPSSGCGSSVPAPAPAASSPGNITRDIAELERVKATPLECTDNSACPPGSHCDGEAGRCDWDCLSDSDCHAGEACDGLGACVPSDEPTAGARLAGDTPACQAIPESERRAVLLALNGESRVCADDDGCPCGSYCQSDSTCRVECLPTDPPSELTCSDGKVCNPSGRCVAPAGQPPTPIPSIQLELGLNPQILEADTASAARIVEAEVTVESLDLALLSPTSPATVRIAISEARDGAPGVLPKVKCAATAALAASCELAGGWQFDVAAHKLVSAPRKIWVEIPQSASEQMWTLEARSEWAAAPATVSLHAISPRSPADPGHYSGRITWPQANGQPFDLPVDALVTPTHVAILEPTKMLFPEGQVVLTRDLTKTTLVPWLVSDVPGATPAKLNVAIDFTAATYDPTTSVLQAQLRVKSAAGTELLPIELTRNGADIGACPSACATGFYCHTEMNRCLPGATAPDESIVSTAAGQPSASLTSVLVSNWSQPATTMINANAAMLGGRDITGLERTYCYRPNPTNTPGRLGYTAVSPSGDLACSDGNASLMFPIVNRTRAVEFNAQGAQTFDLLDTCINELNETPSAPFTVGNLFTNKSCLSQSRFFTSIFTNVSAGNGAGLPIEAQRLFDHILRQWLLVQSFVARQAVQQKDFDDVLGSSGALAHERFGTIVDLVERDLRVLLDPRVLPQYMSGPDWNKVALKPDYRTANRPVVRWGFNVSLPGIVPDPESNNGLATSGTFGTGTNFNKMSVSSTTNGSCTSSQAVALSDRSFTLGGYMMAAVNGSMTIFSKEDNATGTAFWIELSGKSSDATAPIIASMKDGAGNSVSFTIPAPPTNGTRIGYYAFVVEGTSYKLYRVNESNGGLAITDIPQTSMTGTGPHWGGPGRVSFGCTIPANDAVIYDEVTLWDRPLSKDMLVGLAANYWRMYTNINPPQYGSDPALSLLPAMNIPMSPKDEQAAGMAVQLLDSANGVLDLLTAYLTAERGVMYEECYRGGPSLSRDRAQARVGRTLRLISLMDAQARKFAAVPGTDSAPWLARFAATQQQFAGKRAALVELVRQTGTCANPLGITEDDVPLYHGGANGSSERFFASSRFLATQARQEIQLAIDAMGQARSAYEQQRSSEFNVQMATTDKNERLRKLRLDYEVQLRRFCGAPPAGEKLLDRFLAGTITVSDCFVKCSNMAGRTIGNMPAECVQGEIGEDVLAIQGATIDSDNASNSLDRAAEQFDSENEYCARRQAHLEEDETILSKHHSTMRTLRKKIALAKAVSGWLHGIASFVTAAATKNPGAALDGIISFGEGVVVGSLEEQMQAEQDSYDEMVLARSHVLDIATCYHQADNYRFAIGAAVDVIRRATHDVKAATLRLKNAQASVTALVDDAAGELAVEQNLDRTPPSHHFWLGDGIAEYERHLSYARRLTYLAVRSLEYESQQSVGLRGRVLTTRRPNGPNGLLSVVEAIEQRNAPMQGEQGFVVGETPIVLSLRDEILGLENLTANQHLAPGEVRLTSAQAFQQFLKSDSAKIYKDGVYLGRGIRFELRPGPWAETSCAERIYRVTTSLQGASMVNNARMVLSQENAFGSQQCRAVERGTLEVARVRPNHNLLINDNPPDFVPTSQYTSMNVDGLNGKSRADLQALPEGRHEGFAGRGLYGNYLLLLPAGQFESPAVLDSISDVLIRFDIVEVTNASL